jgi:hypothetical protein
MYKATYNINKWRTSGYHLHLDDVIEGDNVFGWLVNLTSEKYSLDLINTQGVILDTITFEKSRPRLAEMYPNIENAERCGFEVHTGNLSDDENYYLIISDETGQQTKIATIALNAPLLYVHIAKTAGSTVNKVISKWFDEGSSLIHAESKENWREIVSDKGVKFLSGHIPYVEFKRFEKINSFYKKAITFREPYSHIISHLAWICALSLEENRARYEAHPAYIQKLSDKLHETDLSSPDEIKKLIESLSDDEFRLLDNTQTRYIRSEISKECVDWLDLEAALKNLYDFDFIGIDNNISGFLTKIADSYQLEYQAEDRRENVLNNKFGLDLNNESIKSVLLPLVKYDLELYEKVKEKVNVDTAKSNTAVDSLKIFWNKNVDESNYNINFLNFIKSPESFFKKNKIKLDINLLNVQARHHFPIKLLSDAISNSRLLFISPFSGRLCKSSNAVDINTYEFLDDGQFFYVSTHISPKMQHSQSFFNIFIPKDKAIITYDYRQNKVDFLLNKKGKERFLINQLVKLKEKVGGESKSLNKSLVCNFGLAHIGHAVWQDISIFYGLLLDKKTTKNIELAFSNNYYTENLAVHSLLGLPTLRFKNVFEMYSYAKKNRMFPVVLSDNYITEKSAYLIEKSLETEATLDLKTSLDKPKLKKVLLSLRSGSRCCINEKGFYSEIIKVMCIIEPNILFIIDGMNDSFELDVHDKDQVNRLKASLVYEKEIAKYIISENPLANIIDFVGTTVCNSIYATKCSDVVITPWGAGLVKYKWLCNKPNVFIYGSSATLSDTHIHKRLYDMEEFRENARESSYYSGRAIFVSENAVSREDNYILDLTDIINEVTKFIIGVRS